MNNNLVLAVYQALLDGGFAALRFNPNPPKDRDGRREDSGRG